MTTEISETGAAADADPSIDEIETQLAVLVRLLDYLSRRSSVYANIDRASYLMARTLDSSGPIAIRDLAKTLQLEPTTVTRKIATMEHHGLIERSINPDDRRVSLVSLSPLGRSKMRDVRDIRQVCNSILLSEWSDDDLETFGRLLGAYNEIISGDHWKLFAEGGK